MKGILKKAQSMHSWQVWEYVGLALAKTTSSPSTRSTLILRKGNEVVKDAKERISIEEKREGKIFLHLTFLLRVKQILSS